MPSLFTYLNFFFHVAIYQSHIIYHKYIIVDKIDKRHPVKVFLNFRKKLSWSELSVQPRFSKFRDKIIHLVLDDADIAEIEHSEDLSAWSLESLQEKLRWEKIKEWNEWSHALKDNDLIGFGDADEVTSRDNIQLLKYCPLKSKSIDIGIWFPFGRMDQAYKTDFPVSGIPRNYIKYQYTLGR